MLGMLLPMNAPWHSWWSTELGKRSFQASPLWSARIMKLTTAIENCTFTAACCFCLFSITFPDPNTSKPKLGPSPQDVPPHLPPKRSWSSASQTLPRTSWWSQGHCQATLVLHNVPKKIKKMIGAKIWENQSHFPPAVPSSICDGVSRKPIINSMVLNRRIKSEAGKIAPQLRLPAPMFKDLRRGFQKTNHNFDACFYRKKWLVLLAKNMQFFGKVTTGFLENQSHPSQIS